MKNYNIVVEIQNSNPLKVSVPKEQTELIVLLLTAMHLNAENLVDEVIYLELGNKRKRSIYFQRSHLSAVSIDPSPDASIIDRVKENLSNIKSSTQLANRNAVQGTASKSVQISETWRQWVNQCFVNGYSKDSLFKALLHHGFSAESISQVLGASFDESKVVPAEFVRLTAPANSRSFIPNAERIDTHLAEVYTLDNFLTVGECNKLVRIIQSSHTRSQVYENERAGVSDQRTSQSCYFTDREGKHAIASEIERRITSILGIHPSYIEGLQGQLYREGEEFKQHGDYFDVNNDVLKEEMQSRGNRTWTFMVYLNDDGLIGGETEFLALGVKIKPERGKALMWNNLYPDGSPNPYTQHIGCAVKRNYKAILNLWFREKGDGSPMNHRSIGEKVPNYTKSGYRKIKTPQKLFGKISRYYRSTKRKPGMIVKETDEAMVRINEETLGSELIALSDEMRAAILAELQPTCERWSGKKLKPVIAYGIRRYLKGASLPLHRDRPRTHIISAIICLDMNKGQRWPLTIEDNYFRMHDVYMKPGDLLLYEGARCQHGRPSPLNGTFHCNLYVHYVPVDYVPPD